MNLTKKAGIVRTLFLSIPLQILSLVLLHALATHPIPISLIAFVAGLNSVFYYTSFHLYITEKTHIADNGKELSILKIVSNISSALGPAIGGLILLVTSFRVLFILASILLIASIFPLLKTKEIFPQFSLSFRIFKQYRELFAFIGFGLETQTNQIVWPLFIFLSVIGSYALFGGVFSLAFILSIIFVFIIGRVTDKYKVQTLRFGATLNTILWAVRILVKTPFFVFLTTFLSKIFGDTVNISFDSLCYQRAKSQCLNYIMFREVSIQAGIVLLFGLLMLFPNFLFAFILAGLGTLLYLLF